MRIVVLFVVMLGVHAHGATLTLKDSFQSARMNMESIKRAKLTVEQTEEQRKVARAGMIPTISAVGTYTRIDPPVANGPSPFLLTKQYAAGLRLTQPLIRGGLVAAYQLTQENKLLAKYQEEATELNLYQLVITAYYNLAIAQADVKNVQKLLAYSKDRLKEIRDRVKIGRSRKGEEVQAESQFNIADSQLRQALINLKQAEKNFEFYTRAAPGEIVVQDAPNVTAPVEEYILKVRSRPDIRVTQQQARVAAKQIDIAKGAHFPQVDFISNYYFTRTGILATSKWDLGVAVTVPIFQGGGVQAQVRSAVDAQRIAELQSSETQRAAERDIAIVYQNYIQIQDQLKTLKEALKHSEEAYRLNKKDYQYGLVTNLEVLQSLNVFIETKRSYDSLVALAVQNYKSLEAATGVLP